LSNTTAGVEVATGTVNADRRVRLSSAAFDADYLSGIGRPVIVTDATDNWPARSKWTFAFFAERYGDQMVTVADRLGNPKAARRVRLADYLIYCQFPFSTSLAQANPEFPFYLTSFSPFTQHPELLDDFEEPYFIENIFRQQLSGDLKKWYFDGFSWVFIGPKGTLSPFHIDLFGTHAWLAQLAGTKRFVLVPPPDSSPLQPVECVLAPGEVIFIPAGWAHQVVSLEPSISVTFNFVNHSNYIRHLLAISRDLPLWVSKIDTPAFAESVRPTWVSRGFDVRESDRGDL
jgi:histone arginine demethylase JMJD6